MEANESERKGLHGVTVTIASIAAICAIVQIWKHLNRLRYFARRNLPYRKPVPILGNMWPVVSKKISFSEFAHVVYNEFPNDKYFGLFEFSDPVYVLRDPELIKNVTVKYFEHFLDHKLIVDESLDPLMGSNLFSMRGERWKEMRTIVTPIFTSSKMRGMFELMRKCAEDFVIHMKKRDKPLTLDLKDAYSRYTNDVIATTAFGVSVNSLEERNNYFYRMGRDATNFEGLRTVKFFLNSWAPKLMKMLNISVMPTKVANFFYDIVKDTVETRKRENIFRPDLIELLMQAKHKHTDEKLTYQEITAQAFIFFFAGFDGTSSFMCFVSHMLAVHQDIQERLVAEIDSAFEKCDGVLSYEIVNQFAYLEMILNETLRYYSLVAMIDRVVTREFELPPTNEASKPVTLRPGDRVWVPVHGLHHDPQYFPNPEKFDPERFGPENKNNVNPFAFLPFGTGPRSCPGNRFALLETKLVLCYVLRNFRIKTCEKTHVPLVLNKKSLAVTSHYGFWLNLEPREKIN